MKKNLGIFEMDLKNKDEQKHLLQLVADISKGRAAGSYRPGLKKAAPEESGYTKVLEKEGKLTAEETFQFLESLEREKARPQQEHDEQSRNILGLTRGKGGE